MKIPLKLPICGCCQNKNTVWIGIHDTSFQHRCLCGEEIAGSLGSDITIGFKGLYRSHYELMENDDHLLSMVFSAAALEWEIVRLHNKWMEINSLELGQYISTDELEKLLIKHRNIYTKINKTEKLLCPQGFESFISETDDIKMTIQQGFPSLGLDCLIKDLKENLFWPRNRILHFAYDGYSKSDAIKSYNFAKLGLTILNSMDKHKSSQ